MGFMKPDTPGQPGQTQGGTPMPTAEPRPTTPIQGQRTKRKPMQSTFLGQDTTPQGQNMGGKSLIGQ